MKQLIIKFGVVVFLLQLLVAAVVSWTLGYSGWVLLASLTAGTLIVIACYILLRPLAALQRFIGVDVDNQFASFQHNAFDWIQKTLQSLEQQLEQQSIELAKYQERFDAVLSGMIEGVIAIDESGKILFSNRAARSILSIGATDVIGKPLMGFVRYDAVQQATREALKTQKIIVSSFQTYDADRRDVRLRVAPMAGQPMPGMTLVFHDVTELARLENIRRDFVANVSHELKTPLASIKAYAETLRLGAVYKAPENLQFVVQIEQQAEVLNQQIHDLLHLARVESGREAFSLEPVDLIKVCHESISQFADEAEKKGIGLTFNNLINAESICYVWADHEALRTIIDNLISNAIRYSQRRGTGQSQGTVRLLTKLAGPSVVVEVIDNGIGIAPEHQQRIFERFFRVDRARSRELGGTGLGLAIVKHLIQSFGGQIELQSRLGVGSTFRVVFPRFYKQE